MSYPNTPYDELNIDICKTRKAAITRADFHKHRNRTAVIYTTDGLIVANIDDNAADPNGAQSATNLVNTGGDRWVVASWRQPA